MLTHFIINTLIVGSGYALVAMAFRLMFSVSPFFNFTLGAIVTAASYLMFYLSQQMGAPLWSAVPAVLVFSGLFAWALEAFAYRPMSNTGASSMILLVASLGIYTIFEAVVHLLFGPQYQTLGSISAANSVRVLDVDIPFIQALSIICSFSVFAFLDYFMHHTFIGKQIRAVNDSSNLSYILGMKNNRIIMVVSVMAGIILGMTGILVGYDTGMEPTMGFNLLFKGIIGAIIGGMAGIWGAFFGAMFLAFSENLGVWLFASEWRDLVAFVIFITFLYFKPHGIFQKKVRN